MSFAQNQRRRFVKGSSVFLASTTATSVKAREPLSVAQVSQSQAIDIPRDRWMLISLWATWCAACKIQIPDLNRLYQKRDKNRLQVLGVTYDWESSAKNQTSLDELKQRFNIAFPILPASKENLSLFPNDPEIPTSLLLRPGGQVYAMHVGLLTDKMVLSAIKKNS